jgi:DHA1 family tetracycline resistance protein-like MFS transporter
LQGGLSAITNVSMLLGTVFYAQVFGYFMTEGAPFVSPNVSYFVASTGMLLSLGLFLWLIGHEREEVA